MPNTTNFIEEVNSKLQSEIIESTITLLDSGKKDSTKLLEALKKRQQIMNSSYKEAIAVGDYIKVTNPNSPYHKIIGKVLSIKKFSNSNLDFVITDINIKEKILLDEVEKFY